MRASLGAPETADAVRAVDCQRAFARADRTAADADADADDQRTRLVRQ
jgi:hypothetical protein